MVAKCSVDYAGRLSAHLPLATRLLVLKADGSVLVHSDSPSYQPLNWMRRAWMCVYDQRLSESRVASLSG